MDELVMQGVVSLTASIAGVKVAMNGIYKRLDRRKHRKTWRFR
jgi:hypothetical protein